MKIFTVNRIFYTITFSIPILMSEVMICGQVVVRLCSEKMLPIHFYVSRVLQKVHSGFFRSDFFVCMLSTSYLLRFLLE